MIEIWDDDAAFESHFASPHVQALIAKSEGVFAGPPELQRLSALPGGHPREGRRQGRLTRAARARAPRLASPSPAGRASRASGGL